MKVLLKVFIVFFMICIMGAIPARHPYHVSICDIEHHPKTKSLQICIRIFTDDLEFALKKIYSNKVDICQGNQSKIIDSLLTIYLVNQIEIKTENKFRNYQYIGHECDKEATMIYLESTQVSNFNSISIACSIFFDVFEDQTNLIHVKNQGILKSLRLMKGKEEGDLFFGGKKD